MMADKLCMLTSMRAGSHYSLSCNAIRAFFALWVRQIDHQAIDPSGRPRQELKAEEFVSLAIAINEQDPGAIAQLANHKTYSAMFLVIYTHCGSMDIV